ncbi:unnamed protein product [Acanthoscelides obtectus]|uniref:Retrotransposon gag domain-containing protein n=1 Tax=Acanthoscelides obtectus TaxID=200917 RepID=A0A9P0Q4K0_ACAOB|nr:unnamed protein product [Acanthoscelides obtectus]CAK1663223.1 hypothetical protein AOBTE_LOCUS23560 [Acanthoscelides obtectus]
MKSPQFDGTPPWNVYRRQFEAAANANGWSSTEKATALTLALRGDGAAILQRISPEEQEVYEQLLGHLEMRYGQSHLEHVYHTQLKNRFQKSGKSLQEFEADIARWMAKKDIPEDEEEQNGQAMRARNLEEDVFDRERCRREDGRRIGALATSIREIFYEDLATRHLRHLGSTPIGDFYLCYIKKR